MAGAQSAYPEIGETYIYGDPLFRQQQESLDRSQQILALLSSAGGDEEKRKILLEKLMGELFFFSYKPEEGATIYATAADFSLSADTLASLNGLERAAYADRKVTMIIPSVPGLYIRKEGGTELDRRLREDHLNDPLSLPLVIMEKGNRVDFIFYPNVIFTGSERLYFVSLPFRSPLDHYWEITSPYGYRTHPVTGEWEFHNGLDVRAPIGTPLYAAEKGVITETAELDNYGIIVILKHRGGYETRYAHLNEVYVKEGDSVERGFMIGRSGNTGISTGPHLHFEIRRNGETVDPVKFVSQGSR
jgi:murein DD-endopeptidase MepM/ murein hydrolase activator NlpD